MVKSKRLHLGENISLNQWGIVWLEIVVMYAKREGFYKNDENCISTDNQ